eukprot:95386_1
MLITTLFRVLPKLFVAYQCAYEFKKGKFSGNNNCNIRDMGSIKGSNIFTSSASCRDKDNILNYLHLGVGAVAGKSTPLYTGALLDNVQEINHALRDLFDDIDSDHTILNQFISNLTDGLKQEECVSESLDERRTDGRKTYHFKGWQHNVWRVIGDDKGGLIYGINKLREAQTDCTFKKGSFYGLQKTCEYISPGSFLCKPTKKTESIIAFIQSINAMKKFRINDLKKFPIARPANATKLFSVLWTSKDIVLNWISGRKLIYDDQYIRSIEQYLMDAYMQRESFFWSVFGHSYINPFQQYAHSQGDFQIAFDQFKTAHKTMESIQHNYYSFNNTYKLSLVAFGAKTLCDQSIIYGMHSKAVRNMIKKPSFKMTSLDLKLLKHIKGIDQLLTFAGGILFCLSFPKNITQNINSFLSISAVVTHGLLQRFIWLMTIIWDSIVVKCLLYLSGHMSFIKQLIESKTPDDFVIFFAQIKQMILSTSPEFISKSQKKIAEAVKFDGKYVNYTVEPEITTNAGASQCRAEGNIGTFKYIKFHNGRAWLKTVSGKSLWKLNHTEKWYEQLKINDPEYYCKILHKIQSQSQRYLNSEVQIQEQNLRTQIHEEENRKIEKEKKRIKECEEKREEIYSTQLFKSVEELKAQISGLVQSEQKKIIHSQLKVFEEMRKDDSKEFAYPKRITWSRKKTDELIQLFTECSMIYQSCISDENINGQSDVIIVGVENDFQSNMDIDSHCENSIEIDETSTNVCSEIYEPEKKRPRRNIRRVYYQDAISEDQSEFIQTKYCWKTCYKPESDEMIGCDYCNEWYHFMC